MSLLADDPIPTPPNAADAPTELVWLELSDGTRRPLGGTCSIGRSSGNEVPLSDDRISRRHALIQLQGRQEYYVSDLGSANGTFLNGRRLTQRTRLFHGDRLSLGDSSFNFHQPYGPARPRPEHSLTAATLGEVRTHHCWLLVADVEGSTQMARRLPPERVPVVMQHWFDSCRQVIEAAGGCLNKYTGDGFLAYWIDRPGSAALVSGALRELNLRRSRSEPQFRMALHHGEVAIGGVGMPGEEGLSGAAVNFTFRMEKLAGALKCSSLISAPARTLLGDLLPVADAGAHDVPNFDGRHLFYEMA
ncbi:MAG TPA: adenylate/guanylate cyclase domain-containing protein [Verrucomicrobiota bacterium]|nr:hypothetical protein [Verrucomicrobiales bacterium]HRI16100.1 adenylate/guanylate cyclase domain-containing protein [Verrucomicrobiota bacterium]